LCALGLVFVSVAALLLLTSIVGQRTGLREGAFDELAGGLALRILLMLWTLPTAKEAVKIRTGQRDKKAS